jgi:hypothetical protein
MADGPLRQVLEEAALDEGCSMKDLTVLSPQVDPFRIDTPAMHRDGRWLADVAATLGGQRIHLRGLHYMVLGQTRPDGSAYVNDEANWLWLSEQAGKPARWLGYIPFDQITDQRNAAPVVRIFEEPSPDPYLNVGIEVEIPDIDDITPTIAVDGFEGVQTCKLVMVGEKSSLDAVLGPIATRYQADLYLPTGDISDTLIYQMAFIGAEDGRRMVVLYFADADPSGWNMGIVIARKLQALEILHFPGLEFEVHRVALTPDQVRRFDLPSTPLKATEKRAGAWWDAFGVEQTEIDALATLRPDLLRQIAREAVAPFFDSTLDGRVFDARSQWIGDAQAVVDARLDAATLERLRDEAGAKLTELRSEIDAINDALRVDVDDFDLPDIEIPEPETQGLAPLPLLDSDDEFAEQTRRLIDSKAYRS